GAQFHVDRSLGDHIAGVRADDVHTEYAIGLGIGENFHKTVGLEIRLGAAIGGEGKLADIVGNAGVFQFLLVFADRGDFGIGVHNVRDNIVVHVAGFSPEDFRHRHALVHRLVGQHRASD